MAKVRYFDPPTRITVVAGVKTRKTVYDDEYTGTAETLAASGLLALDQFPGQPGLPIVSITYRPQGAGSCAPGTMQVFRNPGGTFRVVIRVSDEEQERRQSLHEKHTGGFGGRHRATLAEAPKPLTLAAITNRRVEPNGLTVESYPPRCTFYTGTRAQIRATGALPKGTVFGAEYRWEAGDTEYTLGEKNMAGDTIKGDCWELRVFDNRYTFRDYLDRAGF